METQNILKQKYTPINGDFYELLEVAAMHNDRCEMVYVDNEGNEHNVISRIEDLYTHNHIEYAVLEEDTIRLDQIRKLNGASEETFGKRKRRESEDFTQQFYSSEDEVQVGQSEFYSLRVYKSRNIIELKALKNWMSMEDIPDLKFQLMRVAEFMKESFGLLNDLTAMVPDAEGTLEAPFVPARGILMNAGLYKVADLVPVNCETIVHDRGSFSVNSVKVRQFKDRYFAENWLTER